MPTPITPQRLQSLLDIEDLSAQPSHAIGQMVQCVAIACDDNSPIEWVEGPRIVSAHHNYVLLGYPQDAIVQADTYTQWVDADHILRTQTTSLVLQQLLDLALSPRSVSLLAPGLVYRRDVRDRWHCAQPHQMDLWRLMPKRCESEEQLLNAVKRIALQTTGLSEPQLSIRATSHPYTRKGVEISGRWQDQWLEIGEAGLIDPGLLERLGIDPNQWGGLAMGWGLDRLVMVRKGLPDIRLLRDPLPSIATQMTHLDPWRAVSRQPEARREISIAIQAHLQEEAITEQVLLALSQEEANLVARVEVAGRWAIHELPAAAVLRLGAQAGQENLLLRITWQSESASLERTLINGLMRKVYLSVHQGSEWGYCP